MDMHKKDDGRSGTSEYIDGRYRLTKVHVSWEPARKNKRGDEDLRTARIARYLSEVPENVYLIEITGDLVTFRDPSTRDSGSIKNQELADKVYELALNSFTKDGYMDGNAARKAGDSFNSIKAKIQALSGNAIKREETAAELGQLIANIPMDVKSGLKSLS